MVAPATNYPDARAQGLGGVDYAYVTAARYIADWLYSPEGYVIGANHIFKRWYVLGQGVGLGSYSEAQTDTGVRQTLELELGSLAPARRADLERLRAGGPLCVIMITHAGYVFLLGERTGGRIEADQRSGDTGGRSLAALTFEAFEPGSARGVYADLEYMLFGANTYTPTPAEAARLSEDDWLAPVPDVECLPPPSPQPPPGPSNTVSWQDITGKPTAFPTTIPLVDGLQATLDGKASNTALATTQAEVDAIEALIPGFATDVELAAAISAVRQVPTGGAAGQVLTNDAPDAPVWADAPVVSVNGQTGVVVIPALPAPGTGPDGALVYFDDADDSYKLTNTVSYPRIDVGGFEIGTGISIGGSNTFQSNAGDPLGLAVGEANDIRPNDGGATNSVAIGSGNSVIAAASLGVGNENALGGLAANLLAVGNENQMEGQNAAVIGEGNIQSGTTNLAVGEGNTVSASHSVVIGLLNQITAGIASLAVGASNIIGNATRSLFVGNSHTNAGTVTDSLVSGLGHNFANATANAGATVHGHYATDGKAGSITDYGDDTRIWRVGNGSATMRRDAAYLTRAGSFGLPQKRGTGGVGTAATAPSAVGSELFENIGGKLFWNGAELQVDSTLPRTAPAFVDDFTVNSGEAGEWGELGWSGAQGSGASGLAVANRPGVMRRTSAAVMGTISPMHLGSAATAGIFVLGDLDYVHWIVAPVASGADHDVRVGISSDWSSATPANAVYMERLAADTTWFLVSRGAGVQATRVNTGVSYAAGGWINLRIRYTAGGTLAFSINGGAEVGITTNVPAANIALGPGLHINPGMAAARSLDIDFFSLKLKSLTR